MLRPYIFKYELEVSWHPTNLHEKSQFYINALDRLSVYCKNSVPRLPRHWRTACRGLAVVMYISVVMFALFNYKSDCYATHPASLLNTEEEETDGVKRDLCKIDIDRLDLTIVDTRYKIDYDNEEIHADVEKGGTWHPRDCASQQRLAVIIPYRNRKRQLDRLLMRLHQMMKRQRLHYRIFVIEQVEPDDFNRGMLLNVGFLESEKYGHFDCYVFHDVDLFPEDDRNLYMCDDSIRQLCSAIDEWRYHVAFYYNAGGVTAISRSTFTKLNGYPNCYWIWGGEDDELWLRGKDRGIILTKPPEEIGKYKAVPHVKSSNNDALFILTRWRDRRERDGLHTLPGKYTVINRTEHKMYTHIEADLSDGKVFAFKEIPSPLWWADWSFIKW